MLKKLLDGLIFGTGFGIAFVAIWIVAVYFILPSVMESRLASSEVIRPSENVVREVPSISSTGRFLGSPGIYSGDFLDNKKGVLSGGEGVISGNALVNKKQLEGLKLRLALNGSVMSQWATTDANGVYRVSVPYGEYKIDGYELDYSIANRVLPNKINHPENKHSTGNFKVGADQEGRGLHFRFVDPIIKRMDKSKYTKGEKVILKWEEYPEAIGYTVQVYEKPDANSWKSTDLFHWPERPNISGTELDLSQYDFELKPGYFYVFEVEARNSKGSLLSNTNRDHSGLDFEILE